MSGSWSVLSVELGLLGLLLIVLGLDLVLPAARARWLAGVSVAGLVGLLGLAWGQRATSGAAFGGAYAADPFAAFFELFFLATAAFVLVMTREEGDGLAAGGAEFSLLVLSATLGMVLVSGAQDLLVLMVALELVTLSFYVMTAYRRQDVRSLEAGLKYLILGALSSGFLVYGVSFLYGVTGSTGFEGIRRAVGAADGASGALRLAIGLILAGIGFKVAAVPFHLWAPDVYEGAPTPAVAFLSVGSKAAGFIVMLRVLTGCLAPVSAQWTVLLALAAAATLCYGNLGAIPQTNIKRLLGYSSIGHAGYLLMGLAVASELGVLAVLYYLVAYLFTNLAVFLVVVAVTRATRSEAITGFAGLAQRSPFLAAGMFLALLSLAGVPPLAGFFGKFLLLAAAVQGGLVWLAVVGALNVVVSLYYYLLIVKVMYMHEATDPRPVPVSRCVRWALGVAMAGILLLGIVQGPVVNAAISAGRVLF